jgi:hypothetical protein
MSDLCRLIWCALIGLFRSRAALEAEILILRHQLNVLRRKSPKRDMSVANPLWGEPRIHGELLKLGIDVGQTTWQNTWRGEGRVCSLGNAGPIALTCPYGVATSA